MPALEVGAVTPSAPTNASVGITSAQALAANVNRKGLVLVNISSNNIYIAFDTTASLYKGVQLTANGGAWSMDDYTYTIGAVNAIAEGTNSTLTIQEFTI